MLQQYSPITVLNRNYYIKKECQVLKINIVHKLLDNYLFNTLF